MINKLPYYMLVALISTIIIETTLGYIFKIRKKKDLINIVLVNIITNPLVVSIGFVINIKYGLNYRRIFMIFIEIVVVILEGFIYKKCMMNKPYKLSFLLNLGSYLIGKIIYLKGVLV